MAENIDAERAAAFEEAAKICEAPCVGTEGEVDEEITWILRNRAARIRSLAGRRTSPSIGEDGLPPLPDARTIRAGDSFPKIYALAYTADQMREFAREAIAADRQSRISADQWAALEAARMHLDAARIARESQQSRLRDKSPQAAQGVPEAWKYRALAGNGEWRVTLNEDCARSVNGDVDVVPLYAAPPLSSEQRAEKGDNSCGS